jgi:hypothetical protein
MIDEYHDLGSTEGLQPSRLGGRDLRLVVALAFILNVILVFPVFTPGLSDIGNFDEARYITRGSSLAVRDLPPLSENPVTSLFYALIYLPVRGSDFWFVYTCAIGRFLLFSLLWISSYLLARKISRISSPLIMVGLLMVLPAIVILIREGGHALFTAVSAFGLSRFLCFYRYRTLKDLWTASTLLGVSLLCRLGEGTFLIISFIALSAVIGISDKRSRETLTAAIIPCVAIVGGYMLTYYSFTGKSPFGASSYFYLSFEEGHGIAYQDKYPGLNFWVEGELEARQLFGTMEENHGSVIHAIRRNPTAYLNRIPRLALLAVPLALGVYGGPLSLWFFFLVLLGSIELVKGREFMLMGILLSSLSYLLIYVLLAVREPYLLLPFPILFCCLHRHIFYTFSFLE